MGENIWMACQDCRQVVDIGTWRSSLCGYGSAEAWRGYDRPEGRHMPIDPAWVSAFVESFPRDAVFDAVRATIEAFAAAHAGHDLRLYGESDTPWLPWMPGWHRWRDFPGPYPPIDVEFPYSVIVQLGIRDWPTALQHYRDHCPYVGCSSPEETQALRLAFEEILAQVLEEERRPAAG